MNISIYDSIFDGITFDDLITAVQCNEKEINEKTIKKVFDEILQRQLEDAKYTLKENMQFILKECKR